MLSQRICRKMGFSYSNKYFKLSQILVIVGLFCGGVYIVVFPETDTGRKLKHLPPSRPKVDYNIFEDVKKLKDTDHWDNHDKRSVSLQRFQELLLENNNDTNTVLTRKFVYHALLKTASTQTRAPLNNFCSQERVKCLNNVQCRGNLNRCLHNHYLSRNVTAHPEDIVLRNTWSLDRLQACCTTYKQMMKDKVHENAGVVDHYPLNYPGAFRYLDKITADDAVRFTIVRHPSEQFLSYYHMIAETPQMLLPKSTFNKNDPEFNVIRVIDEFHQHWMYGNSSFVLLNEAAKYLYLLVVNSQSKQLGWNGADAQSLQNTLQYLDSLEFVGLNENLGGSWSIIRELVRFDGTKYFTDSQINRGKPMRTPLARSKKLPEHTRDQLSQLQWADQLLYERSITHFDQSNKIFKALHQLS